MLPECDNPYFGSNDLTSPLNAAKKRLVHQPGQTPGTLVTDGEMVADWSWNTRRADTTMHPWREVRGPEVDEFERFRHWVSTVEATI